jgi:predicted permease
MDLKFALRSWRKNPAFTLLAVMVMALGIGANTAVFSVVNGVLLKPLAFRDPNRIVSVQMTPRTGPPGRGLLSPPDFDDVHDQSTAFEAMARYGSQLPSVIVGKEPEFAVVTFVSPEFFRVLGVEPQLGRLFTAEELKRGGSTAVVVSHAFWQRHFAGNTPGQTLRLFEKTLPIVGVMPPNFVFPSFSAIRKTDIWIPTNTIFIDGDRRAAKIFTVVARLKTGVSLEQAQAQMTSIAARLEQQYPASNRDKTVLLTRLRDQVVSNVRPTLYMLLGGVAVVLLIACANMANLLLAKAAARTREMAIRAAVGAGRSRILRQLLTESVLLALASGIVGLALALWGTHALVVLAPQNLPRLTEVGIDAGVLAFTFGVSVLASVLFGLAPALTASRVDLTRALKQGGGQGIAGGGVGRMRKTLVIGEIALSVILLAGAGLLIKSFIALSNVALGFRPENLLVMGINVQAGPTLEQQRRVLRFDKTLLAEIAAIPGVSATGSLISPPGKPFLIGDYWIDHPPGPEGLSVTVPQALFSPVSPGTFAALGVPVKRGRDFDDSDMYQAPFTAVINEALARKSFPGTDPIGRVFFAPYLPKRPVKVVGVVGDVRQMAQQEPLPEIYLPVQQHPYWGSDLSIVVRTAADPGRIAQAMRKKVRDLGPEVPVQFTTAEASLSENIATPRFRTLLLGVFSALALCLAMAGVYGVVAYVVGRRLGEIGLRMALGASSGDVLWLVLREGLALGGIGLAVGLAGAVAATRLLTSMLFEVKPADPMILAGVVVLLAAVSLSASYIPARRATRIDPLVALRQE